MTTASEELFDVVDEADRVVDCLPRREVHRRGLRHRAVHVFVFRPDGQLLIHKRALNKEEFPNVWTSSASGHVSAGEDYDTAAPRELQEELGIAPSLIRSYSVAACPATSNEFTVLYTAVCKMEIQFDPAEITEVRWLSLDEIHTWLQQRPADFSPAFRLLFELYASQ